MQTAQPPSGGDERIARPELLRRVAHKKQEIQPGGLGPLATRADLTSWLGRLEPILKDIGVPQKQWSDAAILFVEDYDLNIALRSKRNESLAEKGDATWSWYDFANALAVLLDAKDAHSAQRRKTIKTVAGAGLALGGVAIAAPAVGVLALNAAGFTSGGVAAGSVAAGVQSVVYGAYTTGIFSVCQSIGATAVVSAGSLIGGATSLFAGAGILAANRNDHPDDEDSSSESDQDETRGEDPDNGAPPAYKQ